MPKQDFTTSGNPYVTAFHDLMATSKDFTQFLADPAERQGIRQGFTDAVNRGAIAATLGAPVDMANTALNLGKAAVGYLGNKAGVLSADRMPQLIDNPVGGSEYIGNQMRRLGVVSPNRNALAEGLAGFLPTSPTTSAKAVAAIGAGGVVPGMDLAATVFHGSPHKFDKFDSSKIGTGEGAQAYGHGLYFADSPAVAGGYKDRLSNDYVKPDGGLEHYGDAWNRAFDAVQSAKLLPQDHARAIASQVQAWVDSGKQAKTFLRYNEPPAGYEDSYAAAVNSFAGLRKNPGQLYKVDLPDEAIAKMLDYDKPLSQQAPEVQKAFAERLQSSVEKVADDGSGYVFRAKAGPIMAYGKTEKEALEKLATQQPKGSDLYGMLGRQQEASDFLRQQGIPGIRYLDAGSRGQGQGSSNYVVFPGNENMLRILERNGQPMPAPAKQGIDENALRAAFPDVEFDLSQKGNLAILNRVVVPKNLRETGVGTNFMNALTSAADANAARLALSPSGDFGGSKTRLVDFYKRFGFVPNKGRNMDFTLNESMRREPK